MKMLLLVSFLFVVSACNTGLIDPRDVRVGTGFSIDGTGDIDGAVGARVNKNLAPGLNLGFDLTQDLF